MGGFILTKLKRKTILPFNYRTFMVSHFRQAKFFIEGYSADHYWNCGFRK